MRTIEIKTAKELTAALTALPDISDAYITLTSGRYEFYPENTYTKEYYISNNDVSEKLIAAPLIKKKNIVIDGCGAELIFHGEILPFVIDSCESITVKNLSIDYESPFYSQAKITYSGNGYTDLEFSEDFGFSVENGELLFTGEGGKRISKRENRILVTEFTPAGKPREDIGAYLARFTPAKEPSFLDGMTKMLKAEQLDGQKVRLYGIDIHNPGNYWVCTYADRNAPGFFITDSKNIDIENVRLYHTASMGIIAQLSENITLQNVTAAPREGSGRLLSVSADATHFVNCTGTVKIENCTFINMLDDAANIHGIYTVINERVNEHTLTVKFGHFQQYGVMLYKQGDRLTFVDRKKMTAYAEATVEKAEFVSPKEIIIEFTSPLPNGIKIGDAVENPDRMPEVIIRGCVTGNNRPRGFLITTPKKALVENCEFFNMYQGIHLTGDANDWFESGAIHDLEIRNNVFNDSAFCGEAAIRIDPRVPAGEGVAYHDNISIHGNLFIGKTKRFLFARNTVNLRFYDNTYKYLENGSNTPQIGENGIDVGDCSSNYTVIPKNI